MHGSSSILLGRSMPQLPYNTALAHTRKHRLLTCLGRLAQHEQSSAAAPKPHQALQTLTQRWCLEPQSLHPLLLLAICFAESEWVAARETCYA